MVGKAPNGASQIGESFSSSQLLLKPASPHAGFSSRRLLLTPASPHAHAFARWLIFPVSFDSIWWWMGNDYSDVTQFELLREIC